MLRQPCATWSQCERPVTVAAYLMGDAKQTLHTSAPVLRMYNLSRVPALALHVTMNFVVTIMSFLGSFGSLSPAIGRPRRWSSSTHMFVYYKIRIRYRYAWEP
jgi:hypothetical protein